MNNNLVYSIKYFKLEVKEKLINMLKDTELTVKVESYPGKLTPEPLLPSFPIHTALPLHPLNIFLRVKRQRRKGKERCQGKKGASPLSNHGNAELAIEKDHTSPKNIFE
jgi:hypothetical protein